MSTTSPRVLLVDDQPIFAAACRRAFSGTDIELSYCGDGAEALAAARAFEPTVVLQDLVMPKTDGFTVLAAFQADPELSGVPIVMLSSQDEPAVKSRAFAEGATDYLVKLPDRVELIARVRSYSSAFIAARERDRALAELRELQAVLNQRNVDLQTANAQLDRLSRLDGLTGLANRRTLDEHLAREWRRQTRAEGPMAVLLLDIDFFKPFNDTYGHQVGDDALRRVAGALQGAARRAGDLSARYGGEEFTVVLPDCSPKDAAAVAESVRANIADLKIVHEASDVADHVTISIGVCVAVGTREAGPADLLAVADAALYEAKEAGRNRVCIRSLDAGQAPSSAEES